MLNQLHPEETVLPPGETLLEVLDDRGWTQAMLAERTGVTTKHINEIIKGKAPISHEFALTLEKVLGIRAAFWNNYEAAYRGYVTRQEENAFLASCVDRLNQMPWKEAVKLGWIAKADRPIDQVRVVLSYFRVASFDQYDALYSEPVVSWKKHTKFESNPHALAFWLCQGERLASEIPSAVYDRSRFEEAHHRVRSLTCESDPTRFIPELQEQCSSCGVAVVFVPELKGTCVFGATRWLSPTKALIQLSLRRKSNDFLWFTFFHEAGHILKHGKREFFIEAGQEDEKEREADRFAQDILIPPVEFRAFLGLGFSSERKPDLNSIRSCSDRIGIAPGIVVGRLQREHILAPHDFNSNAGPKVYYEWSIP